MENKYAVNLLSTIKPVCEITIILMSSMLLGGLAWFCRTVHSVEKAWKPISRLQTQQFRSFFFRIWASSIWKVDEMADFTIAEAITNDGAKACSVWASVCVLWQISFDFVWFWYVLVCSWQLSIITWYFEMLLIFTRPYYPHFNMYILCIYFIQCLSTFPSGIQINSSFLLDRPKIYILMGFLWVTSWLYLVRLLRNPTL